MYKSIIVKNIPSCDEFVPIQYHIDTVRLDQSAIYTGVESSLAAKFLTARLFDLI